MNILIYITILSTIYQCEAFLPSANTAGSGGCGISKNIQSSNSRLFGLDEWREASLQSKYTLDSYNTPASSQPYSDVPGVIPILPFPFSGKDTVLCISYAQFFTYSLFVPSLRLIATGTTNTIKLI